MSGSSLQTEDGEITVLVGRFRGGDEAAAGALFVRFREGLYRMALARLARVSDAEDCVQETFARAIRYRESFDAARPFAPWLRSILANVVRARLTRLADDRFLTDVEAEGLEAPGGAGTDLERREEDVARAQRTAELGRLIDELPEGDRRLVNLYYREGWTGPLIAEALQITEEATRQRLSRIRARLRTAYGGSAR